MTKLLFERMIEKEPQNIKEKYVFIVDNKEIAMAVLALKFNVICLNAKDKGFFSLNDFSQYVSSMAYKGKFLNNYVYVLACSSTKANDELEEILGNNYLGFQRGSELFKNKEYLSKVEKESELNEVLDRYVERFEGSDKDELAKFHHFTKGIPTSVFDYAVFCHITENYSLFVCGIVYLYIDGVYVPDKNGTKIKQIIRNLLYDKFKKARIINQIYSLLIDAEELQRDFSSLNNYPKSYINFRDCMLDVKTMKIFPHDPKYLSINQIPFNYKDIEQEKDGQEIEKFLNFAIPNVDDRKMFLEYAGLCMTVDTRQQRFLVLCGLGGTGKSVLIRLLETAVGISNVSNVSMQELSKRFSTSLLVGKTLNSCADLSVEALEDSSTIKKLLGEDWIMAEYKGKDGFMYKNYAKLLFSTNMLPTITAERTNGFYRRLLILKMDRQPDKPDVGIAEKLIKEILYFIKLSIQELHEMYQSGSILISDNSKKSVAQMRKDSDVVQAWIDDCCTTGEGLRIERGKAFEDFKEYCEIEERQLMTRNGFFKALRTKNFAEVRGKSERYFSGLTDEKVTAKGGENNEFVTVTDEELEKLPFD